ncbi:hypothetical protein [Lapillicoccus sp.]|uniref:hypothetical protein n=1 Tax=Lapillicoccus sp. TaxID=1909287 RepID=UPI003983663C
MTEAPKMAKASDKGKAYLDELAEDLCAAADVQRSVMFGMPSIRRRGGKTFAGLYGEDMVFKLNGDAHAEALALAGAHLFEPMAGRPMKQWVEVPPAHRGQWLELARLAEAGLDD